MGGTNFGDSQTVDHFLTNSAGNYILVRSTVANIPSAVSGYAIGCILVATDTGLIYVNTGTASSCSFTVDGRASTSTITSLGTAQNSTPTAAQLIGGVVTQTSATGAGTVTLPTGTNLSAAFANVATGYTFTTLFANLGGGQTLTITGATGSTVVGTATVATGTNIVLRFVCTGTNTWNVYTDK